MKTHNWLSRRFLGNPPAAPRRLDQAYQLLLSWTAPATPAPAQQASKKFCPQCGKEVTAGAKFCPACGAKIE